MASPVMQPGQRIEGDQNASTVKGEIEDSEGLTSVQAMRQQAAVLPQQQEDIISDRLHAPFGSALKSPTRDMNGKPHTASQNTLNSTNGIFRAATPMHPPNMSHEQMSTENGYEGAAAKKEEGDDQVSRLLNGNHTEAYLNFELEDDKKPQRMASGSQSSRESSPQASTSALKDEEEDDKPSRKPGQPVSIAHLPVAEKEAMSTFDELETCFYQNKQIGLAHQQEDSMTCECIPDPDDLEEACGEFSGCINRLTQVECLANDCRCKEHCQNQRFQKRQYAPIEIVKTEKKGFGVRTKADLPKDTFIYEYIGDIVGEKAFQKRMQDYYDEGIEHFYFMMLQKDEFLDATKRGGKGRFLNHSCAPNCYVAKWVVGRRLRMGIFTKRKVLANEELTFNYNVDRYGHAAQECFCGEPNCVGFIGGKTQTDIAGMDDLYLDALGITAAVDALGLKGSKKKKSRKLDEDYFPDMTAIQLQDVPKVASAVRQASSNRKIVAKLLERILLTEDAAVQRSLLRLHGFSLMSTLLHEYPSDNEMIVAVLGVLAKWPLITRNKLISTNIEPTVMALAEREDAEAVSEPAKALLQMWQALEVGYRIPKSMQDSIDADKDESRKRAASFNLADVFHTRNKLRMAEEEHSMSFNISTIPLALPTASPRSTVAKRPQETRRLPDHWELLPTPSGAHLTGPSYLCLLTNAVYEEFPTWEIVCHEQYKYRQSLHVDVNEIIAKARAEAEAKAQQEASIAAAEEEALRLAKKAKQEQRLQKESQSKEKKLYRIFSTVVIKAMSKYRKYLDHESFKKRAKEVCQLMCEKEKKSHHFETEKYDSLTSEKEAKLKKYVKEFMSKLLARKGIKVSSSSEHRSSHRKSKPSNRMSMPTPDTPSNEAADSLDQEDVDMDVADEEADNDLINELVDNA